MEALAALYQFGSPISNSPVSGPAAGVSVAEDAFGQIDNKTIKRYTIINSHQVAVQVITYGAIVSAIRLPDKSGNCEDVVLGYDSAEGYLSADNPYFGATVGRVANRIANASFELDGRTYKLDANEGTNTLHGGLKGFDKYIWTPHVHRDGVTMTLLSPDGDQGFPGAVFTQVTYRLTPDSRLFISIQASTTKPTPINIINHSYFNLGGQKAGHKGVYDTRITINADRYTVVDPKTKIPTGKLAHVEGTPLDLRTPQLMGDLLPNFDYDHNFIITKPTEKPDAMVFVAGALHEPSGRTIELYSDQPGMQLYTANGLPKSDSTKPFNGKVGSKYEKHGAFCFETQNFPDAIHNERKFPNSVLRPGGIYQHHMIFKFGVRKPEDSSE